MKNVTQPSAGAMLTAAGSLDFGPRMVLPSPFSVAKLQTSMCSFSFFFFLNNFAYLFIFGFAMSSLLLGLFSSFFGKRELLSSCAGFSCRRA